MPELKIFGGRLAFDKLVPISSVTMPEYSRLEPYLREIISSGMITNSKFVTQLEEKIATYLNVKNIVAVSSNTAGQMLVLKCLGLEGEVILPSFSFCATSHVLAWNNLKPVFVDIDPATCNMDPKRTEEAITSKTSAILAVHVWGNPCQAEELESIARRHGLKLIIDAAQAIGSSLNGRKVGGFGDAEVFSCSPTKLMTCAEGGLVATNDNELAALVRKGRAYGMDPDYNCQFTGLSARMSEFNAVMGLASFDDLEENLARRRERFLYYKKLFASLPGVSFPEETSGARSNCIYFTVFIDERTFGLSRDQLFDILLAENIITKKYFNPPLHRLTVNQGAKCHDLTITEDVRERAITFPLYSHINFEMINKIFDAVKGLQENASRVRACLRDSALV